jgi:predicted nucleotidyltransferase
LNLSYFLAGATARDLVLENVFGRPPGKLTRGFVLSDWKQFENLKATLISTRRFKADRVIQRVLYQYSADISVGVDLIPFGGIQEGLVIRWPPHKLFAWADRKHEKRDAPEILKIFADYADAGNEDRLYADEFPLLEAAGYDVPIAGAHLLGKDARRIASQETVASMAEILADPNLKRELLNQLVQASPRSDESFAGYCALLLDNFQRGFTEA